MFTSKDVRNEVNNMTIVRFKSTQTNYRKEYLNIKNNTLRKFEEPSDIREEILLNFIAGRLNDLVIEMSNPDTSEYFTRKVKDVTPHKDWYIITWEC